MNREVACVVAVAMSFAMADPAGAFVIENVLDTSSGFYRIDVPFINDHGVIAAEVTELGENHKSFVTVSSGVVETTYEESLPGFRLTHGPWINNEGNLGFIGYTDSVEEIYTGNGGPLTTIASNNGPYSPGTIEVAINDSNDVAFVATHKGALGVYVGDGGTPELVPGSSNHKIVGVPDINRDGGVAFFGGDSFTGSNFTGHQAIYYYDGSQTSVIADLGSEYLRLMEKVRVNNLGQVIFMGITNDSPPTVKLLRGDVSGIDTLIDSDGPFLEFSLGYDINDRGEFATWAALDDGRYGIFAGPDPDTDRVIAVGDHLFGSKVVDLQFGNINNQGEIAFRYLLEDGLHGIAIARRNGDLLGDFNENGMLDAGDIGMLIVDVNDLLFDLTGDGIVTAQDRDYWVHVLANSFYGDANLDGEFNSNDLVEAFSLGSYETGQHAGWAEGDWNGDGVFGSGDLVFAFQDGGYEQGPRASVLSVPEPSMALLIALAATFTVSTGRRKHS